MSDGNRGPGACFRYVGYWELLFLVAGCGPRDEAFIKDVLADALQWMEGHAAGSASRRSPLPGGTPTAAALAAATASRQRGHAAGLAGDDTHVTQVTLAIAGWQRWLTAYDAIGRKRSQPAPGENGETETEVPGPGLTR